RDPDVPVEELLAGRPRSRVVMDTRPFDMRSVALGRRVIEAEEDAFTGNDDVSDPAEEQRSEEAGLAPEGAEEAVVRVGIRAASGGAEPGGDGASALGEEEAAQ